MNKQDDRFEKRLKAKFDESVEALDAATLSKLNRSRHAALAQLQRPGHRWSRWMPATGVAAAALIAVLVLQTPDRVNDVAATADVTDIEILLGEESIEMLEELEFYSWLDMVEAGADVS